MKMEIIKTLIRTHDDRNSHQQRITTIYNTNHRILVTAAVRKNVLTGKVFNIYTNRLTQ